jgi:drug/metabolite transporter (DMT)-like permease
MRRGIALALLAAALFGISAPLAKSLLRDAAPQLLAGLLYAGSGSGLALVWLLRRRRSAEARLTRRDVPWLAAAIAAGGGLGPLLLMIGLSHTPASSAALLLNLEGVFTALLAWVVFHENVDGRVATGMAAIVLGSVLISWQGRSSLGGLAGPLAIAAACGAWALDNNFTQRVAAADPVQTAMLKGLIAGAANLGIASALGARWPGPWNTGAALALGFVSYGVSLVLFVLALRQLGTARTGAYFSTAPFVGAAAAIAFWGEPLTPWVLLGGLCMAAGVWLHVTERHEHVHVHEAMEHEHRHVHDEHHQHDHAPHDPPGEPHTHRHRHEPLVHTHSHYPDVHHRHRHS